MATTPIAKLIYKGKNRPLECIPFLRSNNTWEVTKPMMQSMVCFSTLLYSIPYLALYKKIGNTFVLQWEVHPDIKTYEISADKIIFDRKIQGIRGVCMSKDFIITLTA